MAYYSTLGNVYNYYMTTYTSKTSTRYDTHKKSELRSIYNSIVKLNKESPLYLPNTNKDSHSFAVDLKENARQLHNTIASLGGLSEDDMLNKKVAYSSNSDLVSASFIGDTSASDEIAPFQIEVTSLASSQVNMGKFLPSSASVNLPEDTYSFDVTINDLSYEFQYTIREGETNREIQERLAKLISNADIGLKADIVEDGNGNSSLRLTSNTTGRKNNQDAIFYLSDDNTSKRSGSVSYLDINSTIRKASNAEFLLNGEQRSASSNHFTVDKLFEVTLNRESSNEEDISQIGLKADIDSLTENISNLIRGYNSFLDAASYYQDSYPKSTRLVREMNHISLNHQTAFDKMGISLTESGQLSLDQEAFRQSALSDSGKDDLSTIRNFTNSILDKINQVSLNPMQYVEKTIVAYKNPGHNFISPYITSAYSGMMFNSYC